MIGVGHGSELVLLSRTSHTCKTCEKKSVSSKKNPYNLRRGKNNEMNVIELRNNLFTHAICKNIDHDRIRTTLMR